MAKYFTKPPIGTPLNKAHPLNRGLVGYWSFGEGAGGKTQDLSGNGNHGTLTGIVQGETSGWAGGKFGRALNFDGVNDYVDVGAFDVIDNASQATLSFWGYRSSTSKTISVAKYGGSTAWFELALRNDGAIVFIAANSDVTYKYQNDINNTHNTIGWHYYTMVFDGSLSGNARIAGYIDGVALGSLATNGVLPSTLASTGNLAIGLVGNSVFSEGSIDEVRIYNRALSADEVRQLYTDPFCMFEQESKYRWYVPSGGQVANGNFFQFM